MKPKQPELPGAKPRTEIPATLDYLVIGSSDYWRVEKFRDLLAEFPLGADDYEGQMGLFHQLALQLPRPWEFTRRLFGINPVIMAETASPDDYRRLTRRELCEKHNLKKEALQADLDQLRAMWTQLTAGKADAELVQVQVQEEAAAEVKPVDETRRQEEERIIREAGFDPRMFLDVMVYDPRADEKQFPGQVKPREAEKNDAERSWFAQRCLESKTMLAVPLARMQVRDMLQNELSLSRIQDRLAMLPDGSPEAEKLDKRKGELQERYERQMDKLQEMFPELNVAARVSFRQTIAMLFAAEQDFYGDGNNKRRTALFTAAELQYLSRQSLQLPQPQYRLSLEFLAVEAIHGLYDRNFRSELSKRPRVLKLIDGIGKAAIEAARKAAGIPLTDLEAGVIPGEPGTEEFEELVVFEKA